MRNLRKVLLSITCAFMVFASFATPVLAENPSTDATERNITITCIDLTEGEKVIEEPTKITLHPGESYDTTDLLNHLKEMGYDMVDEVDLPAIIEFAPLDPREEYTVRFVHATRTETNVEMETEMTRTIHYKFSDKEDEVIPDTIQKKILVQTGTVTTDLVTKEQSIDNVTSSHWKDESDKYPADTTEIPWVEGYHTPALAGEVEASEEENLEEDTVWVKKTEEELDQEDITFIFLDTDEANPIDLSDKSVTLTVVETKTASTAPVKAVLDSLLVGEDYEEVGKFLLNILGFVLPEEIDFVTARDRETWVIELRHNIQDFDEIHEEYTAERKVNLKSESGKSLKEESDKVEGYYHKNAWTQDFTADKTISGGEEENTFVGKVLNAFTAPALKGYTNPEPEELEEYTVTENGDVTLNQEIIYKLVKFKLTYVPGEGAVAPKDNPAEYTIEDSFDLKPAEKLGYEFIQWKPVGNKIEEGTTDDKELEAEFKPINYEIEYVLSGGTNNKENPATYTIEDKEIVLKNPTKNGYDFVEWKEGNKIPAGSHGKKTFTALWKVKEYKITYEGLHGAKNNEANPDKYTVEQEIILKDPIKLGAKFVGWKEGNKIAKGSTGDKVFTAQWEIVNPPVNTGAGNAVYILGGLAVAAAVGLAVVLNAKKKQEETPKE